MIIQKTTKIALFIVLIAVAAPLCWGAAGNLNPETPIGSLALLYAEGSADQAPRILALASLDRKNLLQLALIGYKEPQRFPNLYEDAMSELSRQKEKFRQLLRQHNGNVQRALFDAVENNKAWAIDYLVQNGADFNAIDKLRYDYTPLILAANEGHGAIVAQLIAAGADLNARDMFSSTALMKAAYKGHGAIVAQLIANGADVNAKNNNNDWTALMLAAQYGHEAVVAQLIVNGANVNAKNNYGETALSLAEKAVTNRYDQALRDRARAIVDLLTRGG